MKKSRIFLAATLVLAIAGAVAAKAHVRTVNYKYFDHTNTCVTGTFSTDPCPSGTAIACTADVDGLTAAQLYSTTGTCSTTINRSN